MSGIGTDHIVSSYDEELTQLAQTIAEMGGQVEVAIENGTKALLKLDRELADLTDASPTSASTTCSARSTRWPFRS
jgi:phosphate transport system protein